MDFISEAALWSEPLAERLKVVGFPKEANIGFYPNCKGGTNRVADLVDETGYVVGIVISTNVAKVSVET